MTSWPGPATSALVEMLTGRYMRLVPALPGHTPFLLDLAARHEISSRWLGTDAARDPASLERAIAGIAAAFVAVDLADGTPVGLVGCYELDLDNGHAKVGVLSEIDARSLNLTIQGVLLMTEYIFATWNLRKVYVELPDGAGVSMPDDPLMLTRVEGVLRDHLFHDGRFWDLRILAVDRDHWEAAATPALDSIQDLGD